MRAMGSARCELLMPAMGSAKRPRVEVWIKEGALMLALGSARYELLMAAMGSARCELLMPLMGSAI